MSPLLSICIVVRNAAADLNQTLDSLDRQMSWLRGLPAEVVLVDGESTDASLNSAKNWAARCGLSVSLLSHPPRGIYPAMNYACCQASGEWLIYINAGDLLLDASLLSGVFADAASACCSSIQFEAAVFIPGASWGIWIPGRFPACHQSLVYKRDLHHLYGPYDERLSICADRLFCQQISALGHWKRHGVLSATQVSPENASRDPRRLISDLATIEALGLPFGLQSFTSLTLFVLRLERWLGISLSVWIRLLLLLLNGTARKVSLI